MFILLPLCYLRYKVLPDGQEVQINNAAVISQPWADTGKYEIAANMVEGENAQVVMALNIKSM